MDRCFKSVVPSHPMAPECIICELTPLLGFVLCLQAQVAFGLLLFEAVFFYSVKLWFMVWQIMWDKTTCSFCPRVSGALGAPKINLKSAKALLHMRVAPSIGLSVGCVFPRQSFFVFLFSRHWRNCLARGAIHLCSIVLRTQLRRSCTKYNPNTLNTSY